MRLVNYLLLIASTSVFIMFCWGFFRHFRRIGGTPPRLLVMVGLTILAFAGQIAEEWPNRKLPRFAWLALMIYAAAAALWSWSVTATRRARPALAFSQSAPDSLLTHGPFRHIRHPFYTSYSLFWIGGVVASLHWRAWVPALLVIAMYGYTAWTEERGLAAGRLGAAYAAYRARTGMFLPRLNTR